MSMIKVEQRLVTDVWKDDVDAVMASIHAFTRRRTLQNGCRIVLFELAGDRDLHVNVTHERSMATPAGWSGPGVTSGGYVHNRRFAEMESDGIARHIQEMMYARPARTAAPTGGR